PARTGLPPRPPLPAARGAPLARPGAAAGPGAARRLPSRDQALRLPPPLPGGVGAAAPRAKDRAGAQSPRPDPSRRSGQRRGAGMSGPPELPVPDFYAAEHAADWSYRPDQEALFARAEAWRRRHAIPSASADRARVHLLLIDLQKDFCLPAG